MALFQKTKDSPDAPSLPAPRFDAPVVAGEAAQECMRVGQLLVEREQITTEHLANALSGANGDLLQFADTVLKLGADRVEVAKAVAEVTEVALLDSKSIELPDAHAFLRGFTGYYGCLEPRRRKRRSVR